MEQEKETWKAIEGYEGIYEVSTMGRVKSIKYGKERIMKHRKDKDGYLFLSLFKNNKGKTERIHRLVANAFIINDDATKTEINHIDKNRTNNRYSNLEWCEHKYNIVYSNAKTVNQYTIDGEFIKQWESTHEVKRALGYSQGHISSCCRGECRKAYGYIWKYANNNGELN